LAAARGAQQGDELPLLDGQVQIFDCRQRTVALGQIIKHKIAHYTSSKSSVRGGRLDDQRSTSRVQRLFQSSRLALMVSQSAMIRLAARSPRGRGTLGSSLASAFLLTGP